MKLPALAVLTFGLGGCATLDRGVLDEVAVVTDPPGASVLANTGTMCVSPCAVSGARRDGFTVTITKPGYVTQTATSNAVADDAATAAASTPTLSADMLGRVVDVQDGSLYHHDPRAIVVKLEPAK